MKKLISAAACGLLLASVPAFAQSPRASQRAAAASAKAKADLEAVHEELPHRTSMTQMTPEMWLYTQEMQRRDDPKEAVRRKAEFRTAQRQRRIAAREWFGYSNSRPTVNPDPYIAGYSAHWSANNAVRPDQWIGSNRRAGR
ncbi:MAG TPA: hypothetical protein VNH11_06855 [Pirellulales bacterium]|nr:hypothetical protein [Pirellulales bacterium]